MHHVTITGGPAPQMVYVTLDGTPIAPQAITLIGDASDGQPLQVTLTFVASVDADVDAEITEQLLT